MTGWADAIRLKPRVKMALSERVSVEPECNSTAKTIIPVYFPSDARPVTSAASRVPA